MTVLQERPTGRKDQKLGRRPRQNFETWSWFFMRISGLILVFLALLHFSITHILNDVAETDADFVMRRRDNPPRRGSDGALPRPRRPRRGGLRGGSVGHPRVAGVRLGVARARSPSRPQRTALDHRRLRPL